MKVIINMIFNLKNLQMGKKKISTTLIKVIISVVISVLSAVGVMKTDVANVVTDAVTSVVLPDSI